jgi:hypothetical protein
MNEQSNIQDHDECICRICSLDIVAHPTNPVLVQYVHVIYQNVMKSFRSNSTQELLNLFHSGEVD